MLKNSENERKVSEEDKNSFNFIDESLICWKPKRGSSFKNIITLLPADENVIINETNLKLQ